LVGAGPGDPGLLTLRGREVLERADVVVFDHLVSPELLALAPAKANTVYVGKQAGAHTLAQDRISRLLVKEARRGRTVVRLKGGDPLIFGRGGEEAEFLAAAGVPFEIVPGVSSGYAAPAYAGIPVTHRDLASSVAFITGHEATKKEARRAVAKQPEEDADVSSLHWSELATGLDTLVFFMGLRNLPVIASKLITHGRSSQTPVAVIRWGTRLDQQVVTGTLADISARVKEAGLQPPALTVIGDVVALREKLRWFEKKPLFGRRIVVTRAREQASALRRALQELGAQVIELPTIAVADPLSWRGLDQAVARLHQYDWIVFTSANGVRKFFERLGAKQKDVRVLASARLCAIGPATAQELKAHGLRADVVPEEYRAEGIVRALKKYDLREKNILLPRARIARDVVPRSLARLGAKVDVVEAYRIVIPRESKKLARQIFHNSPPEMVTFTSSSTVENFADLLGVSSLKKTLSDISIASIGPITTRTIRRFGCRPSLQPKRFTIPALLEAIVLYFARRKP
jgi:uroporphyrinogen III methyltransferase/synthase